MQLASILNAPPTVFLVGKVDINTFSTAMVGVPTDTAQYAGFYLQLNSASSPFPARYIVSPTTSSPEFATSSFSGLNTLEILTGVHDSTNATDGLKISTNGTLGTPDAGGSQLALSGTFVGNVDWYQGNFTNPGGNIDLCEIITFNSVLTASQQQQVEGYLAQKWGLQQILPATHPYYATSTMQLYKRPVFQRTFQPIDISGCALWLDAADSTTITGSSSVTAWADKSGNANNFTTTSGTITVGSDGAYPSVLIFPNSLTYMTSASSVTWTTSSSVFIVAKMTNIVGGAAAQMIFNAPNTGSAEYSIRYNSSGLFGGGGSSTDIGSSSTYFTNGTPGVTNSIATYQAYHIVDTVFSKGATSVFTLSSPFQGNRYWYGTIAEVIMFTSAITSSQRQQVESYLAWKWGLVSKLPTVHPGKTLPAFSTVFTPKSISGMALWLDAADSMAITTIGSNLSTIKDKSGSGNTWTASGTINLGIIGTSQCITFTGYDTASSISGTYSITAGQNCSVFVVLNDPMDQQVSLFNTGPSIILSPGSVSSVVYQPGYNFNANSSGNIPINSGKNYIATATVAVLSQSTASFTHTVNGTSYAITGGGYSLTTTGTTSITASTFAYNPWSLGELMVFSGTLNSSQVQQIEGYLAWKWGLQNNLPDTHPYKKIKP
jgi:hypothetical protein